MTFDVRGQLEDELENLAENAYCASMAEVVGDLRSLILPPENISTADCVGQFRYLKNPEGGGKRLYSRSRTPYMVGPMDALDDAKYRMVIVVGAERTGKSVAGEGHLFKRLRNGPLTDTIIYLQAQSDVESYADKEFADFFTLHPEIAQRLGTTPSDNKRGLKRVAGRVIQLLPANDGNLRQKEAQFIMATEIDGYRPSVRNKAIQEIRGRQKAFGNRAKAYVESHPDIGWGGGIAAAWKESTRGIFYWPCAECDAWSSPHPLAAKGMRTTLAYNRDDSLDDIARLDLVAESARLSCPHCGGQLNDAQRDEMVDGGVWVFEGQTIDVDGNIVGDIIDHDTAGFWVHGTMSKIVSLASLTREFVSATIVFERTRKTERLKRATVKTLGEVYEGAGKGSVALDPVKLAERGRASGFEMGTVPDGVLFLTAAVDVGGTKFDVGIWGWDDEGRSWLIDRFTLRQSSSGRELRPGERQDDWLILREQVLARQIPLASSPDMALPVAAVAIDTGGVEGVTWKAREFARRMINAGETWGQSKWAKVNLIKGGTAKAAPEVGRGREINVDDNGKPVYPVVLEFTLNVDKLKMLSVERMAIDDGGPGQCYFANGLPRSAFDELVGEVLIDGKWERCGDNETFDLFGYGEAVRIRLDPNRADINWAGKRPIWARPVRIAGFDDPHATSEAEAKTPVSTLGRMAALNRR